MSDIAPNLVQVLKDIYAEAVTEVGNIQEKQSKIRRAITLNKLTQAALQYYCDNATQDDTEKATVLELIRKSETMDCNLNGAVAELEEQLVEMRKGLADFEEDLRTVDPNFGKDLGPELPFKN